MAKKGRKPLRVKEMKESMKESNKKKPRKKDSEDLLDVVKGKDGKLCCPHCESKDVWVYDYELESDGVIKFYRSCKSCQSNLISFRNVIDI